jgi:hypothetical protein
MVIAVLAIASERPHLLVMREVLRAADWAGLVDRGGGLGGQILGYNFLRNPEWVREVARVVAAAVGFGPALVAALLVMQRVGLGPIGWRDSVCGKCGARMRGLSEPRCAACGGEF